MEKQNHMEIRRLNQDDAQLFYDFRMLALETDPFSFVESPDELRQVPVSAYAERLRASSAENFVFGAFHNCSLLGSVGFYQEIPAKRRHKGHIWGVFVVPPSRRQGIARALMIEAIAAARTIPGLDQIFLTVSVTQRAARNMYESLGFRSFAMEPCGIRIGTLAVDEEHMLLELGSQETAV
jgi:ribosomal protein S18 acetylase RimI-like enzyme